MAATALSLRDEDRAILEAASGRGSTPQRLARQARIVLLASQGRSNVSIAKEVGVSRPTVIECRKRFEEGGAQALGQIRPGRGRKRSIGDDKVKEIVDLTLHSKPKGASHWSSRVMAKEVGVSYDTVQRVWDAHGLMPHRVGTFKLSNDPQFVEKLTDVVGLYMNPPEHAIVLCMDEKSQIQALDRTQPSLPMKRGRAGTMTHDYKRNGTTTLFAALNVLNGKVVGQCLPRHRHQEFLKFLRTLDRKFPKDLDLHLILDNYATHNHPKVKSWLAARPRFKLHFTPTSASWLNLVESWFKELTQKCVRRGAFPSVDTLIDSIRQFIDKTNSEPKPYVWTASVESIVEKVSRARSVAEASAKVSG